MPLKLNKAINSFSKLGLELGVLPYFKHVQVL